jgi:hypothetical protein
MPASRVPFTVDEIITATGFRPDLSMLREIRLALDPWLGSAGSIGPLIDPNLHSCGTVRPHGARELAHPEAGFFIAGMKATGPRRLSCWRRDMSRCARLRRR